MKKMKEIKVFPESGYTVTEKLFKDSLVRVMRNEDSGGVQLASSS